MRNRNPMSAAALGISIVSLLCAASGGSAVAASLITTKQIKNNAVTSAKVKNGSLTLNDFKASERAKLIGPIGPAGANGTNGAVNPTIVKGPSVSVPAGQLGTATAQCPAGTKVTGGGYFSSIATTFHTVPATTTSWGVQVDNETSISVDVYAYAVCA